MYKLALQRENRVDIVRENLVRNKRQEAYQSLTSLAKDFKLAERLKEQR